jgi:hypothetical protein
MLWVLASFPTTQIILVDWLVLDTLSSLTSASHRRHHRHLAP